MRQEANTHEMRNFQNKTGIKSILTVTETHEPDRDRKVDKHGDRDSRSDRGKAGNKLKLQESK